MGRGERRGNFASALPRLPSSKVHNFVICTSELVVGCGRLTMKFRITIVVLCSILLHYGTVIGFHFHQTYKNRGRTQISRNDSDRLGSFFKLLAEDRKPMFAPSIPSYPSPKVILISPYVQAHFILFQLIFANSMAILIK